MSIVQTSTKQKLLSTITILSMVMFSACSTLTSVEKTRNSPPIGGVEPVYKFQGRLALNGFDAVAYFNEGLPVKGSSQFSHQWNGAIWHFASETNRDSFASHPLKYAPQYGGYCAWAVGHGYTAKGDPQAWKIVDDKLYLNYDLDVKARWEQDIPTYISRAENNWTRFLKERPEHKGE